MATSPPVITTDFGLTFTGEFGTVYPKNSLPEEIIEAFRLASKELVELGVSDVSYKNGIEPDFICLEVKLSTNALYLKKAALYTVFQKVADGLKSKGHEFDAFISHAFGGGSSVGIIGNLRMPSNG